MTNIDVEYNLKFTTATLGCFLRIPLTRKNLALANILSIMQNNTSEKYPVINLQTQALANLYDMNLQVVPEIFGNQIVMYYAAIAVEPRQVLDPDYTYEKIVDTFFDIVKKPVFEDNVFKIAKIRVKSAMERYYDFSDHIAIRNFFRNWYRNEPEYSELMFGTKEDIESITLDDIKDFYKQLTQAPALFLGQAFDADTLVDLVQPQLDWPGFSEKFKVDSLAIAAVKDFYERTDDSSGLQAQIAMGYGYDVDHSVLKNQVASLVLSEYLSGDEYSELFMKIREKLGAAYAISADTYFNNSLLLINTAIDKSKVDQVEKIISNSVKNIQMGQVDLELFKRAKESVRRNYQMAKDEEISELIQMLVNHLRGRNITLDERIAGVDKLSSEDMMKFSQKLFLNERYCLL